MWTGNKGGQKDTTMESERIEIFAKQENKIQVVEKVTIIFGQTAEQHFIDI